jgi:hypothetical protein
MVVKTYKTNIQFPKNVSLFVLSHLVLYNSVLIKTYVVYQYLKLSASRRQYFKYKK